MTLPEDLELSAPAEPDLEAPDADAAEQWTPADPSWNGDSDASTDLEAPEWDAAEQSRSAPFEDDYR